MLNIIYSNTSLEGHRRLYERLKANNVSSSKHVILVPDRYTLGVERDIIEKIFKGGVINVDVASFTRYAVKKVGKSIAKCLSKEGTVVLLEKILEQNAEKLRYFKKVRGYNFAKELFAAMASLRTAGISPDDIEAALLSLEGNIKNKLFDIAVVMREYESYLADNYSDTITRIDALIGYVESGALADTDFYVLGFNIFSAQQLALMRALAVHARSLSVATVVSKRFFNPADGIGQLIDFCYDAGIEVKSEESFEVVDPCFESIRQGIFGGKPPIAPAGDRVRACAASSVEEEIAVVAREIAYLTRREGYRYKDIAVVNNDPTLIPHIRESFSRCEIPCFIDMGYNVIDGITVKYLIDLLEAEEDYDREKIFKLARHPYCGLEREERKAFVDYCLKYNVKYSRFCEPFLFDEEGGVEITRQKIMSRLVLPKEGRVADYCDALQNVLREYAEMTESYLDSPDPRVAASGHTERIEQLLSEMKSIIPDRYLTVGEMRSLIMSAAAELKTVLSPDNFDVVFVGNTEESRFSEVKIMFIVGANDGVFPKKSGDGLIFSAVDNELMRNCGLTVFPSPIEKNDFEQFVAYDLLAKGMDRLYLSRSEVDASGEACCEGDGFAEIVFAAGATKKAFEEYHDFSEGERVAYRLVSDSNAYRELVAGQVPQKYRAAVKKYLVDKGLFVLPPRQETEVSFEKCFRRNSSGEYVTSVSQLETYFKCPYRHYLKYGLRAEEPDAAELKPSAIGNAIHNVLESFFKKYSDKVYDGKDLSDEIRQVVEQEFSRAEYKHFFTDPVATHILNATKKECYVILPALIDNMRESKFRPEGFEVGFGYRNSDNSILITQKGKTFRLCGRIDRVDSYGDDVIIVDYKTGSVKPDIKSVFCGEKIQLYVYMSYYVKQGRRPAGVFYLPIKSGNSKTGRRYAYEGQLRRDIDLLRAIDGRLDRYEGSTYESLSVKVKVKKKSDGTQEFCGRKNLLSDEDFRNINDYVEKLIGQALSEICEGYAEKKPLEEACKYCPYKRACGTVPARKVQSVSPESFFVEEKDETEERE